jgi:hypothetical protein
MDAGVEAEASGVLASSRLDFRGATLIPASSAAAAPFFFSFFSCTSAEAISADQARSRRLRFEFSGRCTEDRFAHAERRRMS